MKHLEQWLYISIVHIINIIVPGLLHVGLRCSLTTEPEGAARPPASQATVLAMSSQVETSFLNKKSREKLQPKKNKSPLLKKKKKE